MSHLDPIPAFVIGYSDSGFTNPHEMVLPEEPRDCRGDFTHMGAKYWGLETARHRATKVDPEAEQLHYDHGASNWVTIGLKQRAIIRQINCSTRWFTGNQVQGIAITLHDELTGANHQVLKRTALQPDSEHEFVITPTVATEARLELYYEGGLSRVLFFGELAAEQLPERPNLLQSATISHVSNEHYGKPEMAVHGERQVMHMSGWESARTGFGERALFSLATPVTLSEFVVDTYLHRLNPPLTAHLFGLLENDGEHLDELMAAAPRWQLAFANGHTVTPADFQSYMLSQAYLDEPVPTPGQFAIRLGLPAGSPWQPILPFARLQPDRYHRLRHFAWRGPFNRLLYMHYPNGGVHGLKLFGA